MPHRSRLAFVVVVPLAGCSNGASRSTSDSATTSSAGTSTATGAATTTGRDVSSSSVSHASTGSLGMGSSTGDGSESPDMLPESDEFAGESLALWQTYQPESVTSTLSDGWLGLEPVANSLWFNDRSATLLWQSVSGDFAMTTFVRARRLVDPSSPPQPQYRLGGIMARNPASERENYVFIVLGADGNDVSVETKTTIDGESEFTGPPWPDATGFLRICRVGADFELLVAPADDPTQWQRQAHYVRPDLPHTLQVGPMAYANNDPADLRVDFDYVRFTRVETLADCVQ